MNRPLLLYPRKQLDIGWRHLAAGILYCLFSPNREAAERSLWKLFARGYRVHAAFTVRSCFDLCLQALAFPSGSEIIMSALTIREMADIARKHGLVPIPLDVNPETLAPKPVDLERAITPRTRALVVAHLFGAHVPMEPLVAIAKTSRLFVFEDCAQAYVGPEYTGHPETDAAMFSFGSIKTATAVGGALLRLRDANFCWRVRQIQQTYPMQTRSEYFRELVTHVCVKLFTIPLLFGLIYRLCLATGRDFEKVINAVRNLPEGEEELSVIRKQPSAALLALMERRVRMFDADRLRQRSEIGKTFADSLPDGSRVLGGKCVFHSFWVFPVCVNAPERFAGVLRKYGFDATTAGSALSIIEPPPGSSALPAKKIKDAFRNVLYLPVYANMPARARTRLQVTLADIKASCPHLRITDARRVYSATALTIEAPTSIGAIKEVLEHARQNDLPICVMGSRHNLGGHAFSNGTVALDLTNFRAVVRFNAAEKRITVQSGIKWDAIQKAINPSCLALGAMQSDNNFTVGGSLSSNAHGRDLHASTLIESVLGMRILLANGTVVHASRTENDELFRLAIGGYGLFGIILEVDLALAENGVFQQRSQVIPVRNLERHFEERIRSDREAQFFIARPSIAGGNFLDDTIVTVWRRTDERPAGVFDLDHERNVRRDRFLFGLSRKYAWGKTLRWQAEKAFSLWPPRGGIVSRNNAMRPPVSAIKMFDYHSPKDTDVIQEFFVPIPRFLDFFEDMRSVLLDSRANLLGVTIRYVKHDAESFLSYAPHEEAFATVLYINEPTSAEGRAKGGALIQRLVQLAAQHGGTFYLTYARDVELSDLREAYPQIDAFFLAKRRIDPERRFTSQFFEQYAEEFRVAREAAAR